MKYLLLLSFALFISCKENSINQDPYKEEKIESKQEISKQYREQLKKLNKDPDFLEKHTINLLKFALVKDSITKKHPLYDDNSFKDTQSFFYEFIKKIDGIGILFTEKEIEDLIAAIPQEELTLKVPPVFFLKEVELKAEPHLNELKQIKEKILNSSFSFKEDHNFYIGSIPPNVISEHQKTKNWIYYLTANLSKIAAEKNYSVSEAVKNQKILKKEVSLLADSIITSYRESINNKEKMMDIFLNQILYAMDEHSLYLNPESVELLNKKISLKSSSLGFKYKVEPNSLYIKEITEPEISGQLLIGDRIQEFLYNNKTYSFNSINSSIKILEAASSTIILKILRNNKIIPIKITPKIVMNKDKSIQYFVFKNKTNKKLLGYIKLPQFYLSSNSETERIENKLSLIISDFESQNVEGIILDLQNNGGGVFESAFTVLSLFIPGGDVLQEQQKRENFIHKIGENNNYYKGKLVVIINNFSASSSEIVASVLKEQNRAVIVGENSFGKGTIQEIINLSSTVKNVKELASFKDKIGSLKITRSSFHRLDGSQIQNNPITPHINIPTTKISFRKNRFIQFKNMEPVKSNNKVIPELEYLQKQSSERVKSNPLFNEILDIKEQEKRLHNEDEWIFSNLETIYKIDKEKDLLEKRKNKLKSNNPFKILTKKNDNIQEILSNPVIQESMEILNDFVN